MLRFLCLISDCVTTTNPLVQPHISSLSCVLPIWGYIVDDQGRGKLELFWRCNLIILLSTKLCHIDLMMGWLAHLASHSPLNLRVDNAVGSNPTC